MTEPANKKKLQVWLPLLFSLTLILGMMLGYKMRDGIPGRNFFSYEKSTPLEELLGLVKSKYVDDVNLGNLSDTAITAILNKLDPHSVFISAEEVESANEDLAGGFFGIGVEFEMLDDTINVLSVMPDGPAFKAGIQTGDKFIKVNDSIVAGKKMDEKRIKKILRGDNGTSVTLNILRDGALKTFTLTRGIISVSSVGAAYMVTDSIGYIKLRKFTQVTYREFMQALEGLQKKGLKKLILDVRENGGGVLEEAVAIADEFLDGDKLITYTEGKHFPKKEYRCKRPGLFEKGELVLLADEGSASASEVLLGALQDWDRATIIGRNSFGKGLVQEQYDLSDGSAVRLTVARYYTPVGRSIQRSYAKGQKEYYGEIMDRYHDAKMMTAGWVNTDTASVFKTNGGRKVYGGGGIKPDIFIAIDTMQCGKLTSVLYMKGTISNFAYRYQVQNKAALASYKTISNFSSGFTFTEDNWKQFVNYASKDSVNLSNIHSQQKDAIILYIKSALARQLWRNQGMYEVMNTKDKAFAKAAEVLSRQ